MEGREPRDGLLYGIGAYTAWGFAPLYFRALSHVPSWLVVCHRIVWSVLFLVAIVALRREWSRIGPVVRQRRSLLLLGTGAVLIAINWLIFIYAVGSGRVLQASLGYFINPLFSVLLGMLFLGERLRGWQWGAVMIALAAVGNLVLRGSEPPWIAVSLAISFGLYGLVRKKVNLPSLHGLLIESTLLFPLALLVIGSKGAGHSLGTWVLLSLSGVVTAVPLLMFGAAVRRLKLSTLGFLQYIGPSLQFLVALGLRESLDRAKLASFILCWIAIGVYVADSVLKRQPPALVDEPD
jgi:chloramphenicol-sensitive protein RarD